MGKLWMALFRFDTNVYLMSWSGSIGKSQSWRWTCTYSIPDEWHYELSRVWIRN